MSVQLQAGFARVSITPSYPVPMSGYGNSHKRIHQSVDEPIYATLCALSDGEKTLLFYNLDLTGFIQPNVDACREAILAKHGIHSEYILFNACHTHSAPDQRSPLDSIKAYTHELRQAIVGLVEKALRDLAPCGVSIGEGRVKGYNFVRRYLLSNYTYGGDNYGDFVNNTILGHESEPDDTMRLVRFEREGKKDIVLVNWQAHPHLTAEKDKSILTSDVVGYFRRFAEEENGIHCAFFQGCAGNINTHSRIPEENTSVDSDVVGRALAAGLAPILGKMRPVKAGKIRTALSLFEAEINHRWDDRLDIAQRVVDHWKAGTDSREARRFAKENGFNSVYHASEVIYRSQLPKKKSYNIGAVSFGDVCFAWMPNEPYDTTGLYIRATSPFEMTFVLGYTNGYDSYMPTIRAFEHGGYECDTCTYPPGTTERLTKELIELVVQTKK